MIPVCMHVVRLAPVTRRPVYCAAPADATNRCTLHRSHAAGVQQPHKRPPEDPTAGASCRRCDAPVVDDGSFYECVACGDADLVLVGAA